MHTKAVQRGLKMGVVLFIVSEVMFFFAFFWAYFHSSLAPAIEIGSIWPPAGIAAFKSLGRSFIKYSNIYYYLELL
jgi:cytochrome c oxidase subunit 3